MMLTLRTHLFLLGLFGLLIPCGAARAAADDAAALMKLVPAEIPFSAVLVNPEKLDKSVIALGKRISPDDPGDGFLANMKEEIVLNDWADFTKPMAMGAVTMGSSEGGVIWVAVPDFAKRIKERQGASEEGGVWKLAKDGQPDFFAKDVGGGYVLIATNKDEIATVSKAGKSLAEELGGRLSIIEGRDVWLHIQFESIRPMFLAQLQQLEQMVPVFASMAGSSMGATDPAAMTAVFAGLLGGIKSFVEQVSYIDVAGSLDDKAAHVTVATGYKDGAIKSYLAKQKPAEAPAFELMGDRPYMLAMESHFPGTDAPFMDYLIQNTLAAMKPAAPAGADGAANPPPVDDGMKNAIKTAQELYRKIEVHSLQMWVQDHGLHLYGDYRGKDAPGILDSLKQSMANAKSLSDLFGGGVTYQADGSKPFGGKEVFKYTMKADESKPGGAQAAGMFGPDGYFAMGLMKDRVRYAIGRDKEVEQAFTEEKPAKPLSGVSAVRETLEKLPAKRNAVALVDVSGVLSFLTLMKMGDFGTMPPSPPIGVSASFSGEPARIDVYVPLKAIDRAVQAASPKQPA